MPVYHGAYYQWFEVRYCYDDDQPGHGITRTITITAALRTARLRRGQHCCNVRIYGVPTIGSCVLLKKIRSRNR